MHRAKFLVCHVYVMSLNRTFPACDVRNGLATFEIDASLGPGACSGILRLPSNLAACCRASVLPFGLRVGAGPGCVGSPPFRRFQFGDPGSMVSGLLVMRRLPEAAWAGFLFCQWPGPFKLENAAPAGDPAAPVPAPGKLRTGSRPGCPRTNRANPGAGVAGARKQDASGHAPGCQCAPTGEWAATLGIRTEAAEATRPQQRPCAVPT